MKIVHVNFVDNSGGAAKAAYRLNEALIQESVESKLLVMHKISASRNVVQVGNRLNLFKNKINRYIEKKYISNYIGKEKNIFSLNNLGHDISNNPFIVEADIVHLHWINNSMISTRSLKKLLSLNKPIVWTQHDMWAITGGCHYTGGCNKYKTQCYSCHMLKDTAFLDISKLHFNDKLKIYNNSNLQIVTCSNWLKSCVEESKLLSNKDVSVIPNTLDNRIFKMTNKNFAKKSLGINENKKVILFGAMNSTHDKRKGWSYLKEVLISLENPEEITLLIFGSEDNSDLKDINIESRFLGDVKDEHTLQLAYNASNVMVTPSIEDNLPNTVMESIACGTPVVAFDIGGFPDLIDHKKNGYLAREKDVNDLIVGINWVLNQDVSTISNYCVEKFNDNFNAPIVASKYIQLYKKLLNKSVNL